MIRFVVGLVLAIAAFEPALADRAPTPEERARVEAALRSQGFQRWEEIEFDRGQWEVDDAVGPDGRAYELKLDPNTMTILEREPD